MASVTGYDSGAISISDGIHTIYLSADDIAEINRIVAERQKKIEDAERAEYERLKKKFDPVVAMPEPTPSPATEVKPCPKPWCNEALVLEVESKGSGGFRIVCHHCGDRSPWFSTREKLFDVWNHRPGEEAVAEECARIADALAEAPDIELNTIGLSTSDFALYHIRLYARSIARKIRSRFGGKP